MRRPLGILGKLGSSKPSASSPPALADPFAHLYPPNLSAAEREQWEKDLKEKAARALGFPPSSSLPELKELLERDTRAGIKSRLGAKRGGRPADQDRDLVMMKEFLMRQGKSGLKDTPLMAKIGAEQNPPLGRSAAIAAIKRELAKIVR
jgi:hypothetical protein